MIGKFGARKLTIIAACVMVAIIVAAAVLIRPVQAQEDPFPPEGYRLSSTVMSEGFTSFTNLDVSTNGITKTYYSYTDDGLLVTLVQNGSSLTMEKSSLKADSVHLVMDVSALDSSHYLDVKAFFKVRTTTASSWYYGVTVRLTPSQVQLIPDVWMGEGTPKFQEYVFLYDVKHMGVLDLVVSIKEGNVVVGVNGFEKTLDTDYQVHDDLTFAGVTLSGNTMRWYSPADILVKELELGNRATIVYHDRLHKTITPDGHDFTLALQFHADSANPQQLALMNHLAVEYGIQGEFNGWMDVPDPEEQYSISTSAEYAADLHALQDSGWDIGLHAVTQGFNNRTVLIPLIDAFERDYGPLRSWVDHGAVGQDMCMWGTDPNSEYYMLDILLAKNATIWVNEEVHSHAPVHDLNLMSMRYMNDSYPGIYLQRTSSSGFLDGTNNWQDSFGPVTMEMQADRQRVYASNSAVLVWHEYTWRFCYVEEDGVQYSRQSHANMGYPYAPINGTEQENANIHPRGTWHLKPVAEDCFAAMSQYYDVWYATPGQVYERSILVDQVIVSENSTAVSITNPTGSDITGFTMYTKERPGYSLVGGSATYSARKGAESYQFVIPLLPAGGTVVLSKSASSSTGSTSAGGEMNELGAGILVCRDGKDGIADHIARTVMLTEGKERRAVPK